MGGKASIDSALSRHIVSVSPNTNPKMALKLMEGSNVPMLPVLENGRLVGIVYERDLGRKGGNHDSIEQLMERPLFVEKSEGIDSAIKYMLRHKLSRIPVVDSAIGMRCIGIVSSSELLNIKKNKKEKQEK